MLRYCFCCVYNVLSTAVIKRNAQGYVCVVLSFCNSVVYFCLKSFWEWRYVADVLKSHARLVERVNFFVNGVRNYFY